MRIDRKNNKKKRMILDRFFKAFVKVAQKTGNFFEKQNKNL